MIICYQFFDFSGYDSARARARVHARARQSLDGATVTLRLIAARRLRAQPEPDAEVDHGWIFR